MLRQPSLKPVSLNKGFSFGCRPCFKSLSGFGWHGVTGGSRRGGCPAVRCRPVCTTLQRSGLRRDAHRRCRRRGRSPMGNLWFSLQRRCWFQSRCRRWQQRKVWKREQLPRLPSEYGNLTWLHTWNVPEFTSVDLGMVLPRRFLLPPFWRNL